MCCICGEEEFTTLLSLNCGNIDNSSLYQTLNVVSCNCCGHIFVPLTDEEKEGVVSYYIDEYSMYNKQSPNKQGDMPGSSNTNSLQRYENLYSLISSYLNINDKILDMGCSNGGFLRFLHNRLFDNLYGFDFSPTFVEGAKNDDDIVIRQGFVEDIPFDETFDFLIADQVVEHLFDPNKIFTESARVLKEGGYLCISVPDSMEYINHYFFDFYWVLMREHIHHFDETHLISLAGKNGFSHVETFKSTSPFINKETKLPTLSMIFKYNKEARFPIKSFSLKKSMDSYFKNELRRLEMKDEFLKDHLIGDIYLFGMSRELMYLYENTILSQFNLMGVIDDTPSKQSKKFHGMEIYSNDIIGSLSAHDVIFITSFAHKKAIRDKIILSKFKGRII